MSEDYTPPGTSSDSRTSVKRLKRANDSLRQQLKDALSSDKYFALTNKIAEQEKIIAALQEENKTLRNELRRAKKDIESLNESNGDLPKQINDLTMELRNAREKNRKMQEKLENQEKTAVQQQQRMVDLETKSRKYMEQIREFEGNNAANNGNRSEAPVQSQPQPQPYYAREPPPKKPAVPVFPKKKPLNNADKSGQSESESVDPDLVEDRERAAEARVASALRLGGAKKAKAKPTPAKVPPLPLTKADASSSEPLTAPSKPSAAAIADKKPKKPSGPQPAALSARPAKKVTKPVESSSVPSDPSPAPAPVHSSLVDDSYTDDSFLHSAEKSKPKSPALEPSQDNANESASGAAFWSNLESESERRARELRERDQAQEREKPFFQLDSRDNSRHASPRQKEERQEWFSANVESPNAKSNNQANQSRDDDVQADQEAAAAALASGDGDGDGDSYEDDFE